MTELAAVPSKFLQWSFPNPLQCCLPKPPPQFHYDEDESAHHNHINGAPLLQTSSPSFPTKTAPKSDVIDVGIEELIASINSLSDADNSLENLRSVEKEKQSPTTTTTLPPHIDPRSRAYCIDCLVDAADKLHCTPSALHLAVSYFNRYISQNHVEVDDLRLVGLTCLIIASKHDAVVDQFQFDNYARFCKNMMIHRDDLIRMENCVASWLGSDDAAAPTAWSFLEKFVGVAGGGGELACVASYIAEVSLLSSNMLGFLPSMVAASSVFLAQYVLEPSEKSWSGALRHHTMYRPCDLRDCVLVLHDCCYGSSSYCLPAITIKYSKKKYQYVAFKTCPTSIPLDVFEN